MIDVITVINYIVSRIVRIVLYSYFTYIIVLYLCIAYVGFKTFIEPLSGKKPFRGDENVR